MSKYKNTKDSWGSVSRFFHWAIAFFVIVALITITIGTNIPKDSIFDGSFKMVIFNLHKSCGITVLFLSLFRLLWRIFSQVPDPVKGLSPIQVKLSKSVHAFLYIVLFMMPISGLIFSKYPTSFFFLFQVEPLAFPKDMAEFAVELHEFVGNALFFVIALHTIGALWHHYANKDKTLLRMLKG